MSATIEQSVETETQTIEIPVTISLGEPGTFSHSVLDRTAEAPKGSQWRVTWILNPLPDGHSAFFLEPPVSFTLPLPEGVDDPHVKRLLPATQCQLTFTSHVKDVNAIRYELHIHVQDSQARRLVRSTDIVIDPTIAIVEDPIGG